MTNQPNPDDLTPEERRRQLATIPGDAAAALRLMTAMAAGDGPLSHAVIAEIGAGGRALVAMTAMASMSARLAYELEARVGDTADDWLHVAALNLLDQAEATAAEFDDEGGE